MLEGWELMTPSTTVGIAVTSPSSVAVMMVFMNSCNPSEVSDPHQPSAEMAFAEVAVTRVEPKASTPAAGTPMAPALRSLRRERLVLSRDIKISFHR